MVDEKEFSDLARYVFEQMRVHPQTELAIMFAQKQAVSRIKVFGATGGRLDHLLSNLWLMADPKFDDVVEKLEIIDQTNTVTFLKAGEHTVLKQENSHYLGFMPINDVKNFKIIDNTFIRIYDLKLSQKDISKALILKDVEIEAISRKNNSLEDYFLNLIKGGKANV